MVGVEVGNRMITLVPVHVDHQPVKRADTRHAPTLADTSYRALQPRHAQNAARSATWTTSLPTANPLVYYPAQRLYIPVQPDATVQTIMTHIVRLAPGRSPAFTTRTTTAGSPLTRPRSKTATPAANRGSRATASSGRSCLERLQNRAARTNGMCASRSASWPSCATADGPRGAASRDLYYRAALGIARRSGRVPHPVVPPRRSGPGRAGGNREPGPSSVPVSQCPLVTDLRLFSASAGRWQP
jgi:hypothetical protein